MLTEPGIPQHAKHAQLGDATGEPGARRRGAAAGILEHATRCVSMGPYLEGDLKNGLLFLQVEPASI